MHGKDRPSDSIRRTSQEELSPKGWKVGITARKATMPETDLLKSKICLVGERGVGKSSLIRRYVLDQFDDKYVRTLGAKVEKKTMRIDVPGRHAQLGVADLAEMAETFGCTYVLTSAKNGQNVEDAFLRLATQIARARVPGDRVSVAKPS